MAMNREIPQRIISNDINRINKMYSDAYLKLYKSLKKNLDYKRNPNFSTVSMYAQYKEVEGILTGLRTNLTTFVPLAIENAFNSGYITSLTALYEALGINSTFEKAWKETPFSSLHIDKAKQLAKDTMADLLQATNNTEYSVKTLVRDTFNKHLSVNTLVGNNSRTTVKEIMKELSGTQLNSTIQNNLIGIVDRGGRRWKADVYADMVVRTKMREAQVEGMKEYVRENNGECDLAQIPYTGATDPCKEFEGLIISLTGATPGYRTYDELRATNLIYHPRCTHSPKVIYDLDMLHSDEIADHNKISKNTDKILKAYER